MARGKRTKIIKRLNKETPEKANNPSAHSAASYRPRPFVFLRYSPKCSVPLLSGTVFSPSSLFMTKIRRHLSGRAANACSSRSILQCKEFGARIPSDIEVFKPFHKPHHTATKVLLKIIDCPSERSEETTFDEVNLCCSDSSFALGMTSKRTGYSTVQVSLVSSSSAKLWYFLLAETSSTCAATDSS